MISAVQYNTVQYSTVQYSTVQYSIILSVTPVEEVSSRNPGCEVKQVPKGVRMGTCVDSLDIIDNI